MRPVLRGRAAVLAAVGAALALAAPAGATPIEISLRIEGSTATIYEGPLRTDTRAVSGGDGSGAHPCGSGRPSVLGALADAAEHGDFGWHATWNPDFQDFFVDRIGGDHSSIATAASWSVLVDRRYSGGACATDLDPGDEVLWAYGTANRPLILTLTGPARAAVGEPVAVTVRDSWIRADSGGADGGPVAGARVGGATTDASGQAVLSFDTPGLKRLKAERDDAIRSNALDVCVGDVLCQGALAPPGTLRPATRRTTPSALTVLRRGARYLARARAEQPLTARARLRVRRALRLAQPVLAGRAAPAHRRGLRLTARELTRLRRCARPDGRIVCRHAAPGRPVWHTARAVALLAATIAARGPAARR